MTGRFLRFSFLALGVALPSLAVTSHVDTQPSGLIYYVDNVKYNSPQTFQFADKSCHVFAVDQIQPSAAGTRYVYVEMDIIHGGGSVGVSTSWTRCYYDYNDYDVSLLFRLEIQLTMVAGPGGTTNPAPGSHWYSLGDLVPVSAITHPGFSSSWTSSGLGGYTGSNSTASVLMLTPITQTASFTLTGQWGINFGGDPFTDPGGGVWEPGSSSNTYGVSSRIGGTETPFLYQSEQFGVPSLAQSFSLPNGKYNVRLKFAEIYFTNAGQRVFDIDVNDNMAVPAFDPVAAAGASNTAVDVVVPVTVTNNSIDIKLAGVRSNAKISAIAITPAQIEVTLSPVVARPLPGQSIQFNATVVGAQNTGVGWKISPQLGTISPTGLYTAPLQSAGFQTVTVTAFNTSGPQKPASATITLGYNWLSQDIGAVRSPGSYTSLANAYTISGAGDLNFSADAFRFTSIPLSGDGSITARITGPGCCALPNKAGVMIRESTNPGAPYVMMSLYSGIAGLLQARPAPNASTSITFGATGLAWVRLARSGNTFTGYVSNDGVSWQQVGGPTTVNMNTSALVGMAVSSGGNSPYPVVFDNVDVSTITSISINQTITSLAPGQQTRFGATILGNANPGVIWSVSPIGMGTIDPTGLYTAPAGPLPQPTNVIITAVSAGDTTKSASVPVQLGAFLPIRVNAGGPSTFDSVGTFWRGDTGSSAGTSYSAGLAIANSFPQQYLYQSEHFHTGSFRYTYTVPPGTYDVTLKFAEIYFTQPGQRRFILSINGMLLDPAFDIVQAAGAPAKAIDRTFTVATTTGVIDIAFDPVISAPKVNAIQILAH